MSQYSVRMEWALPPAVSWPRFLRLLRKADPPRGWLEDAAALPDLRKRPLLLRWIAQHPRAPAHLRTTLLGRLPWRALAAIAQDPAAHPQARAQATDRLKALWPVLTLGERRSLAPLAPRPLWPLIWRTPDRGVLTSLLNHPRLSLEALLGLLQPPLRPWQLDALATSPWLGSAPLSHQVLDLLDQALREPACELVLGHGAPWIKALEPPERLVAAAHLGHAPLRRACRTWAVPALPEE